MTIGSCTKMHTTPASQEKLSTQPKLMLSPESPPNSHDPQSLTNTNAITFATFVGDTQSTQG